MRPLLQECWVLVVEAYRWSRRRWLAVVAWIGLLAAVGAVAWRYDHPVMLLNQQRFMDKERISEQLAWDMFFQKVPVLAEVLHATPDPQRHEQQVRWLERHWSEYRLAGMLRAWGAFVDVLSFTAVLLALGLGLRSVRLQRAACACLVAGLLAGVIANASRLSTGRPRPRHIENTGMADGFYGPHPLSFEMSSFPSGHVSASTGGAVALAVALPVLAPVVLVSSAGVVWACVWLNAHWTSDAAVGVGIGLGIGLLVGTRMRRRSGALGS